MAISKFLEKHHGKARIEGIYTVGGFAGGRPGLMAGSNTYRVPVGANLLAICSETGLQCALDNGASESPDYSYWAEMGGETCVNSLPENLCRYLSGAGRA